MFCFTICPIHLLLWALRAKGLRVTFCHMWCAAAVICLLSTYYAIHMIPYFVLHSHMLAPYILYYMYVHIWYCIIVSLYHWYISVVRSHTVTTVLQTWDPPQVKSYQLTQPRTHSFSLILIFSFLVAIYGKELAMSVLWMLFIFLIRHTTASHWNLNGKRRIVWAPHYSLYCIRFLEDL